MSNYSPETGKTSRSAIEEPRNVRSTWTGHARQWVAALCGLGAACWIALGCRSPDDGATAPALTPVAAAPAPRQREECSDVVGHLRSLLGIEFASIPGAMIPIEGALAIATTSCREDRWPPLLRRCVLSVPLVGANSGRAGLTRCVAHVSASLRARIEPKLRALY